MTAFIYCSERSNWADLLSCHSFTKVIYRSIYLFMVRVAVEIIQYPSLCTVMHSFAQSCTALHSHAQSCTVLAQLCTVMHSPCTVMHSHAQSSTALHSSAQFCTALHSLLLCSGTSLVTDSFQVTWCQVTNIRWFPCRVG